MDIQTAQLNKAVAKSIGARVVADSTVKLRLRCVGYPESSPHNGDAVLVSATSLILKIDTVADTTVGSGGTLAFATYTTLGALVDAINASANWEAEIVAGLRSDTINGSELLARSTATFRMFEAVEIKADSSDNGVLMLQLALDPGVAFDFVHPKAKNSKRYKDHRVSLTRVRGLINTNAGEVIAIKVWEVLPEKAAILRLLAQYDGTDNTEKDSGASQVPVVSANYGNSLLIQLDSTGTGYVDTGAYLDAQGLRE